MDWSNIKVVFVLSQIDKERLEYDPKGAKFLNNKEVYITTYSNPSLDVNERNYYCFPVVENKQGSCTNQLGLLYSPSNADELSLLLNSQGLLTIGNVLVRSPYDFGTFVPLNQASEVFAMEKHLVFAQICGLLGAKKVTAEQCTISNKKGKKQVDLTGSHSSTKAAGNASVDIEDVDRIAMKFSLNDTFRGGTSDISAAKNLLTQKHLWGDVVIKSLVELLESGIQISSRTIKLEMTQESKNNIYLAASLSVPSFVKIKPEYKLSSQEMIEYYVTYKIDF